MQTHTSLETHGGVCEWDGDKLTAWVSTQAVHGTREGFAQALKIPQANVRVITDYMGGGFGSKLGPDMQGIVCARLAKMAGSPVKLMLDRKEEHLVTGNRPSAFAKVNAGVDAEGKLTAFDAQTWGTGGAGAGSGFPLPYIYVFPNRRQRAHRRLHQRRAAARDARARASAGCFVTEVLMDELADRLRMDPLEFRLRNLPPLAPNAKWRSYFPMGAEASAGAAGTSPAIPRRARSSAGSAARPTGGPAPAPARARTARSPPTAASSCASARRTSAPARARSWR